MAGLGSLTATSSTTNTELPSWYQSAQQNVIDEAKNANIPQAQQTVGQQAVSTLTGANNPYAQAQGVLGDIASGASNPWITDAGGNVTPNTNTALGGLFNAQQQYLNQVLPSLTAGADAAAIGSGNFGSLRGLTASNKVRADALAKMQQDQYQTALQAQDTAIKAASGLGNVGTQGIENALKTAEWQQSSPLASAVLRGKVLSGIGQVGSNVTKTANQSPLATVSTLGELMTGSPLAKAAIGRMMGQDLSNANSSQVLGALMGGVFGKGNQAPFEISNPGGGGAEGWRYFSDGTSIDPSGNYYQGGQLVYSPSSQYEEPVYDSSAYGDYGGGDFGGYDLNDSNLYFSDEG